VWRPGFIASTVPSTGHSAADRPLGADIAGQRHDLCTSGGMARHNPYLLSVLRDWRRRAAARGEHANRVVPAERFEEIAPWRAGCVGCYRDARTIRAVGHRPGCFVVSRRAPQ
jgi:hypothetical protein